MRAQLGMLVVVVAVLSAFVKNIGALAIMIPIAFQFARRSKASPSTFLMPMAFASLLGGLMTQIGTSPNIVVSRLREEITGTAFTMFDFTPVGLVLTAAGSVFLILFYWILPQRTRRDASLHEALDIKNYAAEAKVVKESTVVDKTVADLFKIAGGDVAHHIHPAVGQPADRAASRCRAARGRHRSDRRGSRGAGQDRRPGQAQPQRRPQGGEGGGVRDHGDRSGDRGNVPA